MDRISILTLLVRKVEEVATTKDELRDVMLRHYYS